MENEEEYRRLITNHYMKKYTFSCFSANILLNDLCNYECKSITPIHCINFRGDLI